MAEIVIYKNRKYFHFPTHGYKYEFVGWKVEDDNGHHHTLDDNDEIIETLKTIYLREQKLKRILKYDL